jgi:hypothetical protein
MAKTTKPAAKGARQTKTTKAPPPATEKKDNRYLRATRLIIEAGDGGRTCDPRGDEHGHRFALS